MKMPFGKYKGYSIEDVPLDYVDWLRTIELKGPLKIEVTNIVNSEKFKEHLKLKEFYRHSDELDKKRQLDLEKSYIKDIEFWGRVSPNSTIEAIRKHDIDVDLDTWQWLLRKAEKTYF